MTDHEKPGWTEDREGVARKRSGPRHARADRWRGLPCLAWLALPVLGLAACEHGAVDGGSERAHQSLSSEGSSAPENPAAGGDSDQAVATVAPAEATAPAAVDAAPAQRVVWVLMKDKAIMTQAKAIKDWRGRGAAVRGALATTAAQSQAALRALLAQKGIKHRSFWIVNALRVEADQATIDGIAKRSDVAQVLPDVQYEIPPLQPGMVTPKPQAVEWGVESIRAPKAWSELGAMGAGIVVASVDTGVEWSHPALTKQYRGQQGDGSVDHNYNWFDPTGYCRPGEPCDNVGHGTHTMGTMVGDDGADNQIGVAPQARWIAAKGCELMGCSVASLMAAMQWIVAPTDLNGENPRDDLRPHIVNNSWGGPSGDPLFAGAVEAWVNAGIFPAFSIGNSGASCGTAGSPGDYELSYAAGAYDQLLTIADFSSRGPTYPDGRIKPNLAAPGVDVRSSVPGGGYESHSGTSMASPHLSGTVALMWSAAPSLIGDIPSTRAILDEAAVDTADVSCGGTPENNNVWGQGRLDAYGAVERSPIGPTGTLAGKVTSAADGQPVPGAVLLVQGEGRDRTVRVNSQGEYSTRLATGSYTVTVTAFAFISQTTSVAIAEGATTQLDLQLVLAPAHAISGTVRTAAGQPLPGARVTILGTPLAAATTDGSGQYGFAAVPDGTYEVRAQSVACYEPRTQTLELAADASLDFALPQKVDGFGYSCVPATYGYISANTELPILDSYVVDVALPFPFTLYGQTYETAQVSAFGYLSFLRTPFTSSYNVPIPEPGAPNGAIYPFWDELNLDPARSSVRTEIVGTAPQRQFVIEWRDVYSWPSQVYTSFEVVLFENSRILMQYPAGDDPWQQGLAATIGLEDETGGVAFQYSYNEASVPPQTAVLYSMPPSGTVQGTIVDANDRSPVVGAQVQAYLPDGTLVRSAKTTPSGFYRLLVPEGSYRIVVAMANYDGAEAQVSVVIDQTVTQDFVLQTGLATLAPANLQLVVPVGQKRTRTLVLGNQGTAPLTFKAGETGGKKLVVTPTRTLARATSFQKNAANTKGLFASTPPSTRFGADATGDVLASFVPAGVQWPWGLGFNGNLWVSDQYFDYYSYSYYNTEFTPQGAPTGRRWPAASINGWPSDLAYDSSRNLMCQLETDGDNGIHCFDPGTGVQAASITGVFEWTELSQRGLAYRPDDDSFYVGGWNSEAIFHIAGLGAPEPGATISMCKPADGMISGLAFNPSSGTLWVATNSPDDTIYELNPEDCTTLSVLAHPAPGWAGAGLDMDDEGNLWMMDQNKQTVLLVDSGVPAFGDVPWLALAPSEGNLEPGGSVRITVDIDTAGLTPGIYLAKVLVQTTAAKQTLLRVPVSLVVSAYQQAVVAGGTAFTDSQGDPWVADRAYTKGGWGYVQKSKTASTNKRIGGTADQRLFKTQRINPYAYRFDNVPNGIYQVELNFAELANVKIGRRLYDVILENTQVLPAHDIAYEVGLLQADKHTFFVEVADGQMDVRLIPRSGFELPVINSLRVTHRPDR